jgi:hypothetical protein
MRVFSEERNEVATLEGALIADRSSVFDSGIAVLLQQECQVNVVVSLDPNWEVEVRSGSAYVVARTTSVGASSQASSDDRKVSEIFLIAYEAAQKGLDFLSVTGKANLSIRDALDESLVWWREDKLQVLRVIGTARSGFSVSGELEVRDEFGNLKPPPTVPAPVYHECLRYFRLAQVTDDLFDAYRNLWLSLEMLLSSRVPKTVGERVWLRNALTQAHNDLDLTTAFEPSESDVVAEIINRLYDNARLPLFHATASRRVFVPHSLRDRETVSVAIRKLSRLLLFLIEKWLNIRRPSGGVSYYFFDTSVTSLLAECEILVTDSDAPADPAHKTRAEAGLESAVSLRTRHATELSSPGRQFWLGQADTADLHGLTKVTRFAVERDDTLYSYHELEAELIYSGVDRLEAQIGFFMVNIQEPKYLFTA